VPVATLPAATTLAHTSPTLEANPDLSAADQLLVIDGLREAIEDWYVYPEVTSGDWSALASATRGRVESGMQTDAFYLELEQLVRSLGDEHSYFQTPVEVAEETASLAGGADIVGVGLLLKPLEKGWVTVLAVLSGTPAEFSGLRAHDSILAVDGLPLVENGVSYPGRIRGPECSAVVLTVRSPGEEPRDLTVVRARYVGPLPIDARLVPASDGSRVGYIFVPTFLDETIPEQVRQALEGFGPLNGLIFDNRMNGGGLGSIARRVLGFFTSGPMGTFVTREGEEPLEIEADPVHNSQDVPMVVLVAEDTESYGEVFSGILHDIGRAALVGQTTLGNVEQLRRFDLTDGSRLWLASARFDPLNTQSDWEALGIIPDVEVIADWDTFSFETDPAISASLELLGH
jgi:carboxyl-terminal processing protease